MRSRGRLAGLCEDPAVPVRPVETLDDGLTTTAGRGRPFGRRIGAAARRRAPSPSTSRRSTASTTISGGGARGDPPSPLRQCDPRAALEPSILLDCVPITMVEDFGVEDQRPFLRPCGGAPGRRGQPPDSGRRCVRDGIAVARRPDDDQGLPGGATSARSRPRTPGTTYGASTTGTSRSTASRRTRRPRRMPRCVLTSRTGAGQASRSSYAPANGCRSHRPSSGWSSNTHRGSDSALRPLPGAESARRQARSEHRHPLDRGGTPCRRRRCAPSRFRCGVLRAGR